MNWVELKTLVAEAALHKDALHIYAGVALQITTAAWMMRPVSDLRPWAAAAGPLALNEYLDLYWGETKAVEAWQIAGSLHDAWNTLLLPTLLLLARYAPGAFIQGGHGAREVLLPREVELVRTTKLVLR